MNRSNWKLNPTWGKTSTRRKKAQQSTPSRTRSLGRWISRQLWKSAGENKSWKRERSRNAKKSRRWNSSRSCRCQTFKCRVINLKTRSSRTKRISRIEVSLDSSETPRPTRRRAMHPWDRHRLVAQWPGARLPTRARVWTHLCLTVQLVADRLLLAGHLAAGIKRKKPRASSSKRSTLTASTSMHRL